MMEHAGGRPDSALEPNGNGTSHWATIEDFDFGKLDSIASQFSECKRLGDFSVVDQAIKTASDERASEAAKRLLAIIIQSKRPGMTAHQLAWATGLTVADGENLPILSARYGVTKQAFQQGAAKAVRNLELKLQLRPRLSSNRPKRDSKERFSFAAWSMQGARWITARLMDSPLNRWPKAKREWMKRALKPIAEFYERL